MTAQITALATLLASEGPKPEDVKAGWTAFVVFLLLLLAVGLLGWSLSRQLKKADRNKEAGILPSQKDRRAPRAEAADEQGPAGPADDQAPQAPQPPQA